MNSGMLLASALYSALAVFGVHAFHKVRLSHRARLLLGSACGLLGIWASFQQYLLNESTKVGGVPFPVVILQLNSQGQWLDYVGPQSMVFALVNVFANTGVGLLLVVLLVATGSSFRARLLPS
jgi:hypothetical protein